ncbi:MAG TPA: hypothetical protein VD931_19060 [Baekduia sp.]|nr:hypothetical protein [Baekduia sp.]
MAPAFGLCDHCVHQFLVHTTRGSTFSRCDLHKVDPRFRKYPPVPVLRCPGFERRAEGPTSPSAA